LRYSLRGFSILKLIIFVVIILVIVAGVYWFFACGTKTKSFKLIFIKANAPLEFRGDIWTHDTDTGQESAITSNEIITNVYGQFAKENKLLINKWISGKQNIVLFDPSTKKEKILIADENLIGIDLSNVHWISANEIIFTAGSMMDHNIFYKINTDNPKIQLIFKSEGGVINYSSLSPSKNKVVYEAAGDDFTQDDPNRGIYILNLETGDNKQIFLGWAKYPVWISEENILFFKDKSFWLFDSSSQKTDKFLDTDIDEINDFFQDGQKILISSTGSQGPQNFYVLDTKNKTINKTYEEYRGGYITCFSAKLNKAIIRSIPLSDPDPMNYNYYTGGLDNKQLKRIWPDSNYNYPSNCFEIK
jgi:WD40 repeat protein